MRDLVKEAELAKQPLTDIFASLRTCRPGQKLQKGDPSGKISLESWFRVRQLIVRHSLPCTIFSQFGFSFTFYVLGHSDLPEASRSDLETLLMIDKDQFPYPFEGGGGISHPLRQTFAFCRRKRNLELLSFYDIELPDNIDSFTY